MDLTNNITVIESVHGFMLADCEAATLVASIMINMVLLDNNNCLPFGKSPAIWPVLSEHSVFNTLLHK